VKRPIRFIRRVGPLMLMPCVDTARGSLAWDCGGAVVSPGSSERCGTGPLEYAPPAYLYGIGLSGYVTGRLSSTSFLLPDGSSFIANSPFFGVPEFGDLYTVQDPVWRRAKKRAK
jgi:hypothetical protein